jgi:hypothetical protein
VTSFAVFAAPAEAGFRLVAGQPDGTRRLVEVYRADLPWSASPPRPGGHTSDEELAAILRSVDLEV